MDWLSIVGNLSSVAGLVVTIYVANAVRKIHHRYVRHAMLRSCLDKLVIHRRSLRSAISKTRPKDVRSAISRINAVFENLARIEIQHGIVTGVEWRVAVFGDLESVDIEFVVSRASDSMHQLDHRVEALELEIEKLNWSGSDE